MVALAKIRDWMRIFAHVRKDSPVKTVKCLIMGASVGSVTTVVLALKRMSEVIIVPALPDG